MHDVSLDQLPYDPNRLYEKPLIELTQSAVTTYMSCPQKYVFRYLMLLVRKGLSVPLTVGKAVHLGLETLLDPDDPTPPAERLPKVLKAVDDMFEGILENPNNVVGMEDRLEHSRCVAHALLEAWWILYGDIFSGWVILDKEMIVRTAPGATIHSPIEDRMAGMIDGLVQDQNGDVWLLEHKTRARLGNLSLYGLELDPQALWYMILCLNKLRKAAEEAERTGKEPKIPKMPIGFMYDAMQKPQHRLNKDGFEDCKRRMVAALLEDPEKYFSNSPILVEQATIDAAYRNFKRIIKQMDSLTPETVTMNTRACEDYGGCPYRPLCQNRADASNPLAVLQMSQMDMFEIAQPHTELSEGTSGDDVEKWEG